MLPCKLGYTAGFVVFSPIEFYFGFLVLLIIIIFYVNHLYATSLVSFLTLLMFHCTYPIDLIILDSILISHLCIVCHAHYTIFNAYFFNLDLSIHVCLFMHATWHSPHHSLGSSDSPGSSCPDLRVWSL